MGNHSAGALIVSLVGVMLERRLPGETALDILDVAVAKAKKSSGFSPDVEFDDDDDTGTPLGDLIFEAFAPNGLADREEYDRLNYSDDDDAAFTILHEATYGAFTERYGFC